MKKAFNLVELSVVLLIVGIVAGMVLKGKSLLEASYYKSEAHKVDKIRSAVFALMAKYNGSYTSISFEDNKSYDSLTTADNATFDTAQFFDNGLLDENSLKLHYADDWRVSLCQEGTNSAGSADGYLVNGKRSYICAYHHGLFYDIMCNLEVLLDDQNLKGGFGLATGDVPITPEYKVYLDSTNKIFECDKVKPREQGITNPPPAYGYLVFK
ncbi:MAG: type II secretion system GspH family protein [Deferribacteraceae bacterium]|nr:type II secretion system GspH family protein [Deferribacteraceae bacterium]